MKSVLQAMLRLTMAFGNLIDIIVMYFLHSSEQVSSQTIEFAVFAVLMLLDMLVLALIARKYKYKEETL